MISLKERLTELLIKNNLISQENLDKALTVQKEKGGRLSDILVKMGFIDENDLTLILSQSLGLPPLDMSRVKIDPSVIKIIPQEIARYYQIIPISLMGNSLTLAMADPLNIFAIDDVKALTGFEINPIISRPKDIMQAIENYYGTDSHQMIEDLVKGISDTEKMELVRESKDEIESVEELVRLTQEAPVIKLTDAILKGGIDAKASDILIEPLEDRMRIRYRVDGVLMETESPPKNLLAPLISRVKVISALDIAEHRLPQDGRFKIHLENREVDFRVSILPTSYGEKVALRILDKATATLDIDKLGFDLRSLDILKSCSMRPHGMILVCGPTGSGKTTTLYSVLKYIDSPERNIITVEDPVEYQLQGINQVTARPDIGLTFAASLRSILRQDPDIIMIGEIRDFETVDIAIKAALTGHLVLSTLHTTTAAGSIVRLVDMGVEPFLLTSSLIAIISQRLLRKICLVCKESYSISDDVINRIGISNLPSGKQTVFFRGKGCKRCFNSGYSGRIGIVEVLVLSPKIKELIMLRAEEHKIKNISQQEGMITLREDGVKKAIDGLTTLEEVLKVTAPDKKLTS
ncbi:MAG: ATPase, T2SS/T4P/T4SS family [Candidatus Omnitrophota bacterium]|nr:ATPase, T2SS/T4P/T4SS family [Candidatus Omnitrophota bacterium]